MKRKRTEMTKRYKIKEDTKRNKTKLNQQRMLSKLNQIQGASYERCQIWGALGYIVCTQCVIAFSMGDVLTS